MFISLYNKL